MYLKWACGEYGFMPWVVDMGLVCLGEPVCGIGVLCVIKTIEVVGLWSKSQEAHGFGCILAVGCAVGGGCLAVAFGCGRMPCDCGFVMVFRVNPSVG
jgi:hypothetical protein|uniref:Transmembrane protein n=1 Tax=Fagus sylvatica TaxID=28930 RepID=A0A2N9EZ05_FAGSY